MDLVDFCREPKPVSIPSPHGRFHAVDHIQARSLPDKAAEPDGLADVLANLPEVHNKSFGPMPSEK